MDTPAFETKTVAGFGGAAIAVHEMGEGRPVLLLHGLFSSAFVNWIKYGHAAAIAARGFRVIMPDFRVHGESAAPHDPAAYPADVLVRDVEAVIAAYGLDDFDLCGFSLGARTSARMLAQGLRPRRAILAGMGLHGLSGWAKRRDFFLSVIDNADTIKRGDDRWLSLQFMKTMKVDPVAARLLLGTFEDTDVDTLKAVDVPVAVICGDEDRDNGSPQALADILPNGRFIEVPGTHMSSVAKADLGIAMADFLAA